MSYVTTVKKLLSDDLKGLIAQLTGFKEGTQEFKKCEDNAWSIIVDKYYPSVNEHKAKSTLNDFVEKFIVHGFPQKAKNLTMLIDAYSKLTYFKKYAGTEVQWGLIDFIIKLSLKPTNCLEDDPPLDLSKKEAKEEEYFDWGAYLKEGYEKFRLPSEDEKSLSDWSDDEDSAPTDKNVTNKLKHIHLDLPPKPVLSHPPITAHDLKAEARERALLSVEWLSRNTDGFWWKNKVFRELPKSSHPEANYCILWEKHTNTPPETRILSEYKVLRELLNILAKPSKCYFIEEVSEDNFKVVPKTSISSVSPPTFTILIEENFCRYLPLIRKLQRFCSDLNCPETVPSVPATYRAYSAALQKILKQFYNAILNLEKRVIACDSIVTVLHLLAELSPYLNQLDFLSKLHEDAIPDNWSERDMLTNAFWLLCTIYDELKDLKRWKYGDTAWPSQALLILFMESFYPFLKFLAQHMMGYPHKHLDEEFFLNSSGEIVVDIQTVDSREFWEPVLNTASAAITSCSFLMQLKKQSSFFDGTYPTDILFQKFVEKMSELLFYEPLEIPPSPEVVQETFNCPGIFDGSLWDQAFKEIVTLPSLNLCKKTVCDHFAEKVNGTDLSSYALTITLRNAVKTVIEEYMEPKGFAAEILLDQLKLLDHLKVLYSSVQVTSVFSTVLISEANKVTNWKRIRWFSQFENCLSDILPQEYVHKFQLIVNGEGLIQEDVTIFDLADYVKLNYMADKNITAVISENIIECYSQIFSFLLKTRIALAILNTLVLHRIEETDKNILRLRRLCSLRIWFLHVMNTINFYFSTYSDNNFQEKIKELCLNERNLYPILRAHEDFVENWKHHCFISDGHPCCENIIELISLCAKLMIYFKREERGLLADYHLDDFEKEYIDCMRGFASNLQLFDDRLLDRNDTFSFLYDEVIYNLPAPPD